VDFDDDTALRPLGGGAAFEADITDRWWIVTGPNGGLLAALLLRAAERFMGTYRPELAARILTVQFLAGPQPGPVRIDVVTEREGRRVAFTSVAMTQDGTTVCQAKITFVGQLADEFELDDHVMPDVPPPEQAELLDRHATYGNARQRWERRPVPDCVPGVVTSWLRLDPPVPIDAAVLVLMCDNLPPSLRSHEPDPARAELIHTTTVEMTVYLRRSGRPLPATDHCLVQLRSASVIEGLHQEEGEVWSSDGRLLATSRQLALVFRRPPSSTSSSAS
jgi:acyl-CoA thioesterase